VSALSRQGRAVLAPFLAGLNRRPTARRALAVGLVIAAGAILTAIYTRLSMTSPLNSDQASQALQGQDLWSGNLLLRGWTLSTISLFVPDLVLYGLVLAVRGLQPSSVHEMNALMFAMVVLVAIFLARGAIGSRHRNAASVITGILLIAPQLGLGVTLLLAEGSHVGVALVVLVALVVVDRGPRNYFGLALFTAVMTLAVFSDGLADVIGVAPVVVVCGLRILRRRPDSGYDLRLLLAAIAAVPIAQAALWVVRRLHGFHTYPLTPAAAQLGDVPKYILSATRGVIALFGASISSGSASLDWLISVACYVAARWIRGQEDDRISELLVVATVANLTAFCLIAHGDTNRYVIPAFVLASVLAGRAGAALFTRRALASPGVAIGVAYSALLLVSLGTSPVSAIQPWDTWLLDHHLYRGLGSYWQASSVTLETGGRVQVRPILSDGKTANGYAWESDTNWYTPGRLGDVRFVIYDTTDHQFGISRTSMEAVFGPPTESARFGAVEVLVWDRNLVPSLRLP